MSLVWINLFSYITGKIKINALFWTNENTLCCLIFFVYFQFKLKNITAVCKIWQKSVVWLTFFYAYILSFLNEGIFWNNYIYYINNKNIHMRQAIQCFNADMHLKRVSFERIKQLSLSLNFFRCLKNILWMSLT